MLMYKWLEVWVVADTSAKTCYSIPTSSAIYMQEAADVSITLANTHIDGASSFVSTNRLWRSQANNWKDMRQLSARRSLASGGAALRSKENAPLVQVQIRSC